MDRSNPAPNARASLRALLGPYGGERQRQSNDDHLLSVIDDFLKPIWSLVKTCLRQRKETPSSQSTAGLRACIYICYVLLAVFEGSVDYLKSFGGETQQLSSLSFSALVQLDGIARSMSFYRISHAVKHMR